MNVLGLTKPEKEYIKLNIEESLRELTLMLIERDRSDNEKKELSKHKKFLTKLISKL